MWRLRPMKKRIFILLLGVFLYIGSGLLATPQDTSSELIRHYVLLLDGSSSFRITTGSKRYYLFIREILKRTADQVHNDYLPYRSDRDIVSIVYFHFPLKDGKLYQEGLHTSRQLSFITGGFERKRFDIESFTKSKIYDHSEDGPFQKTSNSPIALSELTVLPYINKYIKNKEFSFNGRVNKIYLISLTDELYNTGDVAILGDMSLFGNETIKNKYKSLYEYMKANYQDMTLLKKVSFPAPKTSKKIFFHYYEIKPKVEGITLKLNNKVELSRVAFQSQMLWKGTNNICLENNTPNLAWVEWALPTGQEAWNWRDCTDTFGIDSGAPILSAGCRAGCGDSSRENASTVEILKLTSGDPEQDALDFSQTIWYRGVVDMPPSDDSYGYPFKFRHYLASQSVQYVSDRVVPYYYAYTIPWYSPENLLSFIDTKVERTLIDDDLIKRKLADPAFMATLENYIRNDRLPKRFNEFCETFRGKTIPYLSAEILSETSRLKAHSMESWYRWIALIFYLIIAAMMFLFYYFILRPLMVRFNIEPVTVKNNTFVLDFSRDEGKKETLATISLESLVKSYHPAKINPKFTLSFNMMCEFSYTGEPLTVDYDHEHLLSIFDKTQMKEIPLKVKGDTFMADLPEARFGQTYDLLLNTAAIEDIETGTIGDKQISFDLKLTHPQAIAGKSKIITIHKMKEGNKETTKKEWDYNVFVQVKPERKEREILFTPAYASMTSGGEDSYQLDFTAKTPLLKLFDIEIKNNCKHKFSFPIRGMFSFKPKGDGNKDLSDIIYMSESETSSFGDGRFVNDAPVDLNKADGSKRLYVYIHFDDFENPVDHRNFILNGYFDGVIEKTINIRINRSKEETEALVQIEDGDDAVFLETNQDGLLTDDNSLLVHKDFQDTLPVTLDIPASGLKAIKEGKDSQLFTLHLRNNCQTRTGYYEWELKEIDVQPDDNIEFDGNPIKLIPTGTSGKVTDERDSEGEIEFWIDYKKIKKVHKYHFSLSVKYTLAIRLFPAGQGSPQAGQEKNIQFAAKFLCFHDVKENYLVIDFGTSAISAFYYTPYSDIPGDNYCSISLESPRNHLPGEDDLLPSIINLRNTNRNEQDGSDDAQIVREVNDENELAIAGTDQFVDLPVRDDIFGLCPEAVLNSIKLLIVQGVKKAPIPEKVHFGMFGEEREFKFIDENGKIQKGYPALDSILKSCYDYLLKHYINPLRKGYKRVILTYPNVYNVSHISFLEKNVFKEVFEDNNKIYFENINKESESNSVLYYYLMKRRKDEVPVKEHVLVVDTGAGTLDMSYAVVDWDTSDEDVVAPLHIKVIKRDGIAMAGDTLDKAIALQVHSIIKNYFAGVEDFTYANPIATNSDRDLKPEKAFIHQNVMFSFKIKHILDFKKEIATADEDDIVKICLGDNDKNNGLCEFVSEFHEVPLNDDETNPMPVTLQNIKGRLYIGMRKKEWFELPYLKQFRLLLIEKLKAFSSELALPGELTTVLTGRTSLWPSIKEAVMEAFHDIDIDMAEDIWPEEAVKKAAELKRAVIKGAIQKATIWKEVEFEEEPVAGVVSVRYQKKADGSKPASWCIESFKENSNPNVSINLANSSFFELGLKTSMDFVPFMGTGSYKRDDYCKKNKRVTITMEKEKKEGDYHFYLSSDRYKKGKGKRLRQVVSHEAAFLKTGTRYWPVRDTQLRDVQAEDFTENV